MPVRKKQPVKNKRQPRSSERVGRNVKNPKPMGFRGAVREHLDQRLQSLYNRAMLIERQLQALDEGRFYRVCIFGSARIKPETKSYEEVFELARFMAWEGIDVLTGGGPGLMEAANKGAMLGREEKRTKSLSYGLSIQLEWEPEPNLHLDVKRHHQRFSSRLDDFMRLSNAIVVTPGGIGTVLELFFAWQLIQVKHILPRPIILLDSAFWSGIMEWMKEFPLERGLVSESDFSNVSIVDTPEQVMKVLSEDHKSYRARAVVNRKK